MKTIHSSTIQKAKRLAARAARSYDNPPQAAIRELVDTFIDRLQERIERKFPAKG